LKLGYKQRQLMYCKCILQMVCHKPYYCINSSKVYCKFIQ